MLKLLREVWKTGEATLAYPFEPVEQMPGFRGKPHHDPQRCIACAACATACPPNALTIGTDLDQGWIAWELFMGRCIYCGRCEEVCPTGAIALSPDFELAVMDKQDLYERAEYRLAACLCCGRFFAPQKELIYLRDLMRNTGMAQDVLERECHLLELCPECKRRNDVPKMVSLFREEG